MHGYGCVVSAYRSVPSHTLFLFVCAAPAPTSPFPYTTLFRSNGSVTLCSVIEPTVALAVASVISRSPTRPPARDRKSTRLNSSHRCISYAVFCLKKKKRAPCRRGTATAPLHHGAAVERLVARR